jgi:tetratricopeptide (TPR) repeat protein
MKTIDFSYFIERYNTGEMDHTEITWFEKELEGNESLQKEVLLRKKTDVILERHDIIALRNKLASIEKSRKDELVKNGKLKAPRFRFAAVVTGLIVIGSLLFFSFQKQSSETIYKKYYQEYLYPSTSRSAGTSFDEAIDYFNRKEFDKALTGFQAYLKNNPGSSKNEFLSGVSYMELSNFPDAESSFNKVINKEVSMYTDNANWYLAMCYIATNNKAKAKDQLRKISNSESINKNNARKILRHL